MKRFSLFLGLSFMLSLNFSVTAFAGVPPQCQDGRGNVRCDLKGCQQYCRDYGHRPGNNDHGHRRQQFALRLYRRRQRFALRLCRLRQRFALRLYRCAR